MAYICLACSEIYDNEFDVCPKAGCNAMARDDEIIYVEDVFAPVISELITKGYEVERCYFGNPNNNMTGDPYIVFPQYVLEELGEDGFHNVFDKAPYPWHAIIRDGEPIVECTIIDNDKINHMEKLLRAHIKFARFVEGLPKLC